MNATTDIVEQAIAKQEAEEAGIDTSQDNKGKQDDKETKDVSSDKSGAKDTDKKSGDKETSTEPVRPKYDKDGKRIETDKSTDAKSESKEKTTETEEGKYTAKDALEVDTPELPAPPRANDGTQLNEAEAKYVADNIGEPIVIRGFTGEGDNRKEIEVKAYSVRDIPADFQFANDQQRMAASNGFQNLENKATQLLGNYRQNQANEVQAEYDRRENVGIQEDLNELQDDGIEINGEVYKFPKFTVKPGAKGFDDTPEAKEMAEVLQIMEGENNKYFQQYNQGRPWKHIGFNEAFRLYLARNPKVAEDQKKNAEQDAEDAERRKTASTGQDNRGMSTSNIVKPTVRAGTTTRDILARIDNDDF